MANSEEQSLKNLEARDVKPANEITAENTHVDSDTNTFQFADDAAVKLVIDDTERADQYLNVLQWASGWALATTLYQSPQASSAFDGGNVAQANVPKFIVSNHISSIIPKLMGGIFYEDPPFLFRPGPDTSPDVLRQKTVIATAQLRDMNFEEEAERFLDQMALLGTGIAKWGYCHYKKDVKKYVRVGEEASISTPVGTQTASTPESDDFKIVVDHIDVSRPWFKYCDIRTVLVNPGCRVGDIRKAGYVIYRDYATYADLGHLRDVDGYDIPSEEDLKALFMSKPTSGSDNIALTIPEGMRGYLQQAIPRNFKSTSDPMQNGLEILERWDDEKVIVVLSYNGHNILLRNEANPYAKIPFYSANWRNIGDCFYGQGLGLLVGAEQLVEQGVTNLALDLIAYGLQPTAIRKKGFNTPTQTTRWKLGGIVDVDDDVDKSFKFLQMPPVPSEAWAAVSQAQTSAATTSGANEQVMQGAGSMAGKGTGMRTATGAASVIEANASRLDGPDGRFIRQVFEPWLYQMDELNNDMCPTSVLRNILGDKLGPAYAKSFKHLEYRNAKLEYEVLAGAHLGPKKQMAQFLPIVINMVNNPTFTSDLNEGGKQWDAYAIFQAFAEMAGYKYSQSFVIDMTPERKQKMQQNSPAALQQQKLQAGQQAQLAQFQHEEVLENEKQLGKAGNEVLRQSIEQATTPEEVQGAPGGTGFGSTTTL
jgi:hypothetical protein